MTTEAALTKLAYLLALPGATPESVARDMSVSLRGELTQHVQTVFRHPDGVLPEQARILTALGYAIAQGDLKKVKDIMERENVWVLNDADYAGNTPVVCLSVFSFSVFCLLWFLSLTASIAHCCNFTFGGNPTLFPAARCISPSSKRGGPHATFPGRQRGPVGACCPAPQVRRPSPRRREGRGGDAGTTAAERVGTCGGGTQDDEGEGPG
jgi:hypothetical protein